MWVARRMGKYVFCLSTDLLRTLLAYDVGMHGKEWDQQVTGLPAALPIAYVAWLVNGACKMKGCRSLQGFRMTQSTKMMDGRCASVPRDMEVPSCSASRCVGFEPFVIKIRY